MSQVLAQIARTVTVAKTAPVKVAAKPAAKTVKSSPVATKAIPFAIHNGSRPSAGAALFALTHAWLSLSGMAAGKAYPKAEAVQVAGSTAVAYHIGNGNFDCNAGMLTLTRKGQEKFGKMRSNDESLVKAWVQVLKTGKPSDVVGPKNADHFYRVK